MLNTYNVIRAQVGMPPRRRREGDEIFGTIELSIRWPGGNCERRRSRRRRRTQKNKSKGVDGQKVAGGEDLRSCLAILKTAFVLLLLLSLTPELTVSILRFLCSHLILIPGLLRFTDVAVAVYFNGNPFTIDDRCCRARAAAGCHVREV